MADVAAVLVAAGRGTRAGGGVPKQFRSLGGDSVLRRALALFAEHPGIARVQPVIHPDDTALFAASAGGLAVLAPVHGGATRQQSVRAGLEALGKVAVLPSILAVIFLFLFLAYRKPRAHAA